MTCEHGFDPEICIRCAQRSCEGAYEPVMPFVTVSSVGGPHDDMSYVQGYSMGRLDEVLKNLIGDVYRLYTHPSNLPQADLLAMRFGFAVSCEPWEEAPDDWVLLTFRRSSPAPDVLT